MRICRYRLDGETRIGFYYDDKVVDLKTLYIAYRALGGERLAGDLEEFPTDPLFYLPPDGAGYVMAKKLKEFYELNIDKLDSPPITLNIKTVKLLKPVVELKKLILLAGNYAEHVAESGDEIPGKKFTYPYFFMKPPSTTLTDPDEPILIPKTSPNCVDWEVELAAVIGRGGKHIKAEDALSHVAGYTVLIDVSDRCLELNPMRKNRPKDRFFDWLHGKWHDSFAPIGPCIASSDYIGNPQSLRLWLKVNGVTMQDSSTSRMVFTVAELIEFISSFVTLEPGDIISTGTPSGVGMARGTYLRPGDVVEAYIEKIGLLRKRVEME
ncbi:fumarylacetoacetate hydrolase family protein [Candidatus Bathyarchaeota archaeon]|nr:fumarylacetoacetate hydrolase family protein [Candidatus Bathyarchaeota archaeon]